MVRVSKQCLGEELPGATGHLAEGLGCSVFLHESCPKSAGIETQRGNFSLVDRRTIVVLEVVVRGVIPPWCQHRVVSWRVSVSFSRELGCFSTVEIVLEPYINCRVILSQIKRWILGYIT